MKLKGRLIVIIIICFTIVGAFIFNNKRIEKNNELYNIAIDTMINEDLYSSLELFRELNNFNDSEKIIMDIELLLFNEAMESIESNDFNTAWEVVGALEYTDKDYISKITRAIKDKEHRNFMDELEDAEPYIGLAEELIKYTKWGMPDEIKLCIDYDKKRKTHQSKEYIWFEPNGKKDKIIDILNEKVIRVYDIKY